VRRPTPRPSQRTRDGVDVTTGSSANGMVHFRA
jgi:hypothetical protein